MKIGSFVYATQQGLGYLAKAFYDRGIVTDVMVVKHRHFPSQQLRWYPEALVVEPRYDLDTMRGFCAAMDVMLFFETPFVWSLIEYCHERGTRTVLMTMYECTPYPLPAQPDMFLCPSALDMHYFPYRSVRVTIPIDPLQFPHRQRSRARLFIHNSGWGSQRDRNGTLLLTSAIKHVRSPAKFVIRSQSRSMIESVAARCRSPVDPRLSYRHVNLRVDQLYAEGDVFIFPEKFNGLSLPLQESHASGMLVMASDRYPNNTWLPTAPLIPVSHYHRARFGEIYNQFDEAIIDPHTIAATIDEWYDRDISVYSRCGLEWAAAHSWEKLHPTYRRLLSEV